MLASLACWHQQSLTELVTWLQALSHVADSFSQLWQHYHVGNTTTRVKKHKRDVDQSGIKQTDLIYLEVKRKVRRWKWLKDLRDNPALKNSSMLIHPNMKYVSNVTKSCCDCVLIVWLASNNHTHTHTHTHAHTHTHTHTYTHIHIYTYTHTTPFVTTYSDLVNAHFLKQKHHFSDTQQIKKHLEHRILWDMQLGSKELVKSVAQTQIACLSVCI